MKKTLAIYAIPDVNPNYPQYIHDHNLTLFNAGKVELYLHYERISGKKYDNTLHTALYSLLKQARLLGQDLDLAFVDSVIGRSFISSDGKFRFEADPFAHLSPHKKYGRSYWLDSLVKAYAVPHEIAHIFSAVPFFGMFEENSLLVHFDGGASVSNFSVWLWQNGQLKLIDYHWRLRELSALFNANALNFFILGVKPQHQNSLPGKYMGFAGWGKYDPKIEKWLIENDFFHDIWHDKKRFFKSAEAAFGWKAQHFNTKDPLLQNIAATVQAYFTRKTVDVFKSLKQLTAANTLYYTGGSALNLYVNSQLTRLFDKIYIPPPTNDSGLSLGAGAYVEWLKGNNLQKHLPYLNNWGLQTTPVVEPTEDIPKIAEALIQGKVIGICNGYGEAGPRALGNRSILAMANDKNLARKVSMTMKGREWYRPLAPVMLYSVASQVTGQKHLPLISKFMLVNFKILPKFQRKLRGVIHADGTSRIQVLFQPEDNPFLWSLLQHLHERYGVLGLINTSFNSRGKPIVHYESQAIAEAKQMGLDGLVLNGKFYERKEF